MYYLMLILFALVGSGLVVLTIENLSTQVQLAVFMWQTPSLPLGFVILLAFILGALLLYIVSTLSALRDRSEKKRLRMRVGELEQQVAAMRSISASAVPMQQTATPIVPMPGVSGPPQV